METYTGEQSILSAALGPYRCRGFALTALTDDILVLWYQSTDIAHYTWSATVGEVLGMCNTFQAFLDGLASEVSPDGLKLNPDGYPDGRTKSSLDLGKLNPSGLKPYSDYNPVVNPNVRPDGAKLNPDGHSDSRPDMPQIYPDGFNTDTVGQPDCSKLDLDGGSYGPDGCPDCSPDAAKLEALESTAADLELKARRCLEKAAVVRERIASYRRKGGMS